MTNIKIIFLLVIIISLANCSKEESIDVNDNNRDNDSTSYDPDSTRNYIMYCDEYDLFDINDDYYVQNNVWGFYAGSYGSAFSQCVFHDSLQRSVFGWNWDLDSVSKYPSYPRVAYGWNPWFNKPSISRRLESLNSIIVSFDFLFKSDGIYNTSFDLWIHNAENPTEETISGEIMIWLEANTIPETKMTIENLVIRNETYDFYKNTEWYDYPLFIFLKKDDSWNGEIDIYPFLDYLLDNNHISDDDYLTNIEFGNEIWSGSGCMEIENYEIQLK